MNLKLDENLGRRPAEILREAGHDVATVYQQGLSSASDRRLIDVCRQEERCLVTLDLDFGNPLVFDPRDYSGIALLRLPSRPSPEDLYATLERLGAALASDNIDGRLWVVQRDRVREYQPDQ